MKFLFANFLVTLVIIIISISCMYIYAFHES